MRSLLLLRYSVWVALGSMIVMGLYGLFQIKYHVGLLYAEVTELTRQLEQEEQSTHILRAEWAYLNAPERLQTLTKKYLQMTYMTHAQVHVWDMASSPHLLANAPPMADPEGSSVELASLEHAESSPPSLAAVMGEDDRLSSRSEQAWLVLSSAFRTRFTQESLLDAQAGALSVALPAASLR